MLADHDAGIEVIVEPGAGSHTAVWRLDRHPVAIRDAADLRRCGMQLDLRIRSAFAKAGELAMLSLATDCVRLPLLRASDATRDLLSDVLAPIMSREEWLASHPRYALAS